MCSKLMLSDASLDEFWVGANAYVRNCYKLQTTKYKDIVSSPEITFLIPSLAKSSEMILSVSRMTEARSANTISPRTLTKQNRNEDDIVRSI